MRQFNFGSGQMYGIDTNGAPLRFGALQDVSVDFSADIKMLHGQESFALAVGRGKAKIECKAAFAEIDVRAYSALYFNQAVTTGHTKQAQNEAAAIPGSVAYTVTAANGATFKRDLGVINVLTGATFKQVGIAATPTTGEYKVDPATGIYTFAAGDAGKAILLNYLYNVSASGQTMAINNVLMGAAPVFGVVLTQTFQGKSYLLELYANVSDKLTSPFKQDDFSVPELTFSAQDNGSGQVGYISVSG